MAGPLPPYTLRRSPRSRRLRVTIDPALGVVVTVPPATRRGWAHPEADVEPISLERVRPRTVLSVIGGAIAFYLLATQLTGFQVPKLNTWEAWGWVTAAVLASSATYVAAALNLVGCVKERLAFGTSWSPPARSAAWQSTPAICNVPGFRWRAR